MHALKAYEEVVDCIASGTSPDAVVTFQPSDAVRERARDLLYFEKTRGLTLEETSELDHYMQLEHLMRLAKARSRKYVSSKQIH